MSRLALWSTQPPVQWVPVVLSLGVKRCRGVMLTTHSHLVLRSWMSRSYTFSTPSTCMACSAMSSWEFHSLQPAKKLSIFYGTIKFTRTHQWTLYLASWIQSTSSHIRLVLPSGLFPSGVSLKFCMYFISTCCVLLCIQSLNLDSGYRIFNTDRNMYASLMKTRATCKKLPSLWYQTNARSEMKPLHLRTKHMIMDSLLMAGAHKREIHLKLIINYRPSETKNQEQLKLLWGKWGLEGITCRQLHLTDYLW
jgi:hypothetical protein